MENRFAFLSRNKIKYIVIFAMLMDHIAWAFAREQTPSYYGMHGIGRLTGPVMAYFLVEGYRHTRSFRKYATRLLVFGLLSAPAFMYFDQGSFFVFPLKMGVIYTLFLSLMALWLWDRSDLPPGARECGILGLALLSIPGDWPVYDIVFALLFHGFYDEPKKKWLLYLPVAVCSFSFDGFGKKGLYQLGMFLVPVLLQFYNRKPGSGAAVHKWFFYVFYPLHLLVLGYLRWHYTGWVLPF